MPSDPAALFTGNLTSGGDTLKAVLVVAVPAIIGVGAFFWAARLVLHKLGFGGKIAKI